MAGSVWFVLALGAALFYLRVFRTEMIGSPSRFGAAVLSYCIAIVVPAPGIWIVSTGPRPLAASPGAATLAAFASGLALAMTVYYLFQSLGPKPEATPRAAESGTSAG